MKLPHRVYLLCALGITLGSLSGCVVHDRETVHDNAGYSQGYKEGYYDHEHNRYWHNQAWVDCTASDVHCVGTTHDADASYAQGYKEGYYDREHNRYWHNQAWVDCVENDVHCAEAR